MSRIDEIKSRLTQIETEKITYSNELQTTQQNYDNLRLEEKSLHQELKIIRAIQKESRAAEQFLKKHKDMEYIGKADSNTQTTYSKPFIICNKCKSQFEIFKGNNGIQDYFIAVCPDCYIEVDLSVIQ
jgi:regulator of replication initiation timing